MPDKKFGTARIPYGSGEDDLHREGSRRPVTRGLAQGLTHPVVGRMADKELSRGLSVRAGFPDSDLDSY